MVKSLEIPEIDPKKVKILLVCDAPPQNPDDYFYSKNHESLFIKNTILAFNQANVSVKTMDDILKKGAFLTTAVKSPRTDLTIPSPEIESASYDLEKEIDSYPNLKAILLMGDAAIKAINFISKRKNKIRAIPAGSTYKIRKSPYYFNDIRLFPSYLQTGKNFLIETSKRNMVAEDIKNAFAWVDQTCQ